MLAAAVRFLEARSRSIDEVRRRLTSAGYRSDLVEGAIGRLVELGMLDDAAFARAWVESRDRSRPRGERALRQELSLRGVERDLLDEILAERRAGRPAETADIDAVAAELLLTRHARTLGRIVDLRARRQRAYALLARNGFDPETCAEVSVRFVTVAGDDDDDRREAPA